MTQAATHLVETEPEVRVAVHDFGGDGPDLLFHHANGFHGHSWLPVIEALRPSFRCWAIDARGHGDSPSHLEDGIDWQRFGADVLAVIDHLGLQHPFGVGHSLGGAALLTAEQQRRGTWRHLFLYEAVLFDHEALGYAPDGENPMAAAARRRRSVFTSVQAAYDNYAAKPPLNTLTPEALRAYVEFGLARDGDGYRLKCDPATEAAIFETGLTNGVFAGLGTVQCPVTLAHGTAPSSFGPVVIAAQADALASAETVCFDGLGHFGPLEDPGRVATGIRAAFGLAVV